MSIQLPHPKVEDCQGPLHPLALEGIRLFNSKKYWHAHEALEKAWLDERGEIRHLYRGILQVAVTYLHVQNGNYQGALKVYARSRRWLEPFPDICRGLDIGRLREDLEEVITQMLRLGQDRVAEFDMSLLRPLVTHV